MCFLCSDSHSSSQLVRTPAGSNFGGILPVPFCLGDINLPSWWWTQSLAPLLTRFFFLSYHLLTEWSGPHAGCSLPEETNRIRSKTKKKEYPSAPQRYKRGDAGFYGKVTFSITVALTGWHSTGSKLRSMHQYLILSLRLVRRALLSFPRLFPGPIFSRRLWSSARVCTSRVFAWLPAKSPEKTASPLNLSSCARWGHLSGVNECRRL